jgi:hypothetical protein
MKTPPSNSEAIVRARQRATQWVPLLGLTAAGLALTLGLLWLAHPSSGPVADWRWLRPGWLAGLAVTGLGAAALWRARRRTLLRSAAEMDAVLAAANRLETATALHEAQDAMAKAQRTETEQFLRQSRKAPHRPWLPGLATAAALLAAAHLATLLCWARPVQAVPGGKTNSPVPEAEKPAASAPTAAIEWRSPESETAATAIEEVPLEAGADSATGLRNAVLEIEVNGAPRASLPLPDDLSRPGPHTLKPSIFLDQLDVKTYDIVSYHLRAQRLAAAALPPTVSPVQFVEIKPVREDTFICAGGDQPSVCFNHVTALKAAQLRLLKDNFTLAHAEVGHDNAEWGDENSRVGGEQNQLAARTTEVIALMTTNHYPEPILGLVRESQPMMADAGAKIVRRENQPALAPQGRALGCLTEVEKYLKNSIKLAGASKQPKAADPFQRPKNLELTTHPLTRAGKIDALAKAQSQLAGDLAGGRTNATLRPADGDAEPGAEEVAGTPAERQTKIKRRIGDFLNDPEVVADALKHLQSGDAFAGQAQERIGQNDLAAASEPAGEAARELHQTAAALRAGGDQAAKNQLADALLRLSAAAGNVRRAPQARTDADAAAELKKTEEAVRQAAGQLAAEAQRQRENGATNAAARLDELAKMLTGGPLARLLAQAQQAPRAAAPAEALAQKLDELAERAGQQRNPGPLSRQELARLVDRLERTQANLNNLAAQGSHPGASPAAAKGAPGRAGQPGGPAGAPGGAPNVAGHARGPEMSRAEMRQAEGAQLLDELRLDDADARAAESDLVFVKKLDDVLRAAAESPAGQPRDYAPLVLEINPPLTGLIHALQTELAGLRRPFDLTSQDVAAAPPAYRAAVADYFERVSRDYQPAKDEPGDAH